ncbi:hypothetical protein PYH58_10625 [Mammaliicoccus sciuri]
MNKIIEFITYLVCIVILIGIASIAIGAVALTIQFLLNLFAI